MRHALEKICDPHISILNNISILRENWLRRRDIDNAKLYIHPITYDRLMFELATKPQPWVYEAMRYEETILGIPIKQDPRVSPYHLLIKEEDKMEIDRDSITINIGGRQSGLTFRSYNKLPKKYILNQDACILFWHDDSKTVVRKADDDIQDPVKGFLWAYFLKHSGLSRTKANKYLREIDEAYNTVIDKED